jgi:hypothetical protein
MNTLEVARISIENDRSQTAVTAEKRNFSLKLCSGIKGRERWHVQELQGNHRLAAAVELVLRGEQGITAATANPLTGRVLVHYSPARLAVPVRSLLQSALEFGPMTKDEFAALPTTRSGGSLVKHLIAAEFGCFLLKTLLLGTCAPGTSAVGILLLAFRCTT